MHDRRRIALGRIVQNGISRDHHRKSADCGETKEMRRSGIQFKDLSNNQFAQLENFIQSSTLAEL
jgi:hypothetical protein